MDKELQRHGLAAKALVTVLGFAIVLAGCATADGDFTTPPPTTTAQAPVEETALDIEPPTSADLWSDDRSRIDTPLLNISLDAETQWAIFEQVCGQNASDFCALMAIAHKESRFDPYLVGDDGKSLGIMQINTKWHTGRMEALGVTDLRPQLSNHLFDGLQGVPLLLLGGAGIFPNQLNAGNREAQALVHSGEVLPGSSLGPLGNEGGSKALAGLGGIGDPVVVHCRYPFQK